MYCTSGRASGYVEEYLSSPGTICESTGPGLTRMGMVEAIKLAADMVIDPRACTD